MSRKISAEEKITAVRIYLDGKSSQRQLAKMYGVAQSSIQQWIRNYEAMGTAAFLTKGYKKYSKELKQRAVEDYLSGKGSQDDICKKYGIRSKAKLPIWIKKYNGHEELKASPTAEVLAFFLATVLTVKELKGMGNDRLEEKERNPQSV